MERLEDIVQTFTTDRESWAPDIEKGLVILAKELIEQRKQITELKLLIEHEEKVRTTKASKQTGGKRVSEKFKHGDRVARLDNTIDKALVGTVTAISGKRVAVQFKKSQSSIWFNSKELTHSVA